MLLTSEGRVPLDAVGEQAIREAAFAYAEVLADSCWVRYGKQDRAPRKFLNRWNRSDEAEEDEEPVQYAGYGGEDALERDDLRQAALEGYFEAMRRYRGDRDLNKYIRAWMRGMIKRVISEEGRSHGNFTLRRCRNPACRAIITSRRHYCRDECLQTIRQARQASDYARYMERHDNRKTYFQQYHAAHREKKRAYFRVYYQAQREA